MSTYILMKVLESVPSKYDTGIRLLTFGRVEKAHDRLTSNIKEGQLVLDFGCGAGALTIRAARQGAQVKGIDVNPQMLKIAQKRVDDLNFTTKVSLCEIGIGELEGEESEAYDFVMSGLCLSELSEDEFVYALKEAKRLLKPGGLMLIADEVRGKGVAKRIANWLIRFPLVIITYLLNQSATRAIEDLPEKIEKAGLEIESLRLSNMESFIELVAKKPVRD